MGPTFRPLLLDQSFQQEVERLAPHLPGKHQEYLHFARRPYQGHVDDAQGLRSEREPGAEVGYGVVGVLGADCERGSGCEV